MKQSINKKLTGSNECGTVLALWRENATITFLINVLLPGCSGLEQRLDIENLVGGKNCRIQAKTAVLSL